MSKDGYSLHEVNQDSNRCELEIVSCKTHDGSEKKTNGNHTEDKICRALRITFVAILLCAVVSRLAP